MRAVLSLLLLLLGAPAAAHAEYRVGAGDVLDISVTGQDQLSGPVEVAPDGTVELELLGTVKVGGRDVASIDDMLTEQFGTYLREPHIRVKIAKYGSQKVYVLGAVKSPGRYVLKGERQLLDLLMDAGGPLDGSHPQLHLVRSSADSDEVETRTINLERLLTDGDFTQNIALQPGDILYIPSAGGDATEGVPSEGARVYVVGEVKRPGLFPLEPGATAMAAVLAAGGLTKYASAGRAKVVRSHGGKRTVTKIDLADIMKRGRKDKDVVLEPGDMVIVPGRLF